MSFIFSKKKTSVGRVLEEKSKKAKKLKPHEQALLDYQDRRDKLARQIPKLPEGARKHELGLLLSQADVALGKDPKKPLLVAAHLKLDDVRDAISQELNRLARQAKGVPLDELKRKVAGEVDNLLSGERSAKALPMVAGVRKQMRLRLPATVARCDTLLQDFDQQLAAERQRLADYLADSLGQPQIDIDAFTREAYAILSALRGALGVLGQGLEAVRDLPSAKKDPQVFYDDHQAEPEVKRAMLRSEHVTQEIPRLQAAVDKLAQAIKDLQDQRAKATTLDDKKALEADYNAAMAQKLRLSGRLAQMTRYHGEEDERFDELMLQREKAEGVDKNADAMLNAIGSLDDPAFNGLQASASEPGHQTFPKEALAQQDGQMRALLKRSSERVIRAERIFPGEPDVTELSGQEYQGLLKLLEVASQLAAKGRTDLASAAQADVNKLWMEFVVARKNALPPAPEVPVARDVVLRGLLQRMEPRVLDLQARGHAHAKILANARQELLDNVAAEVLAQHFGWDQLDREVDDLAQKLTQAEGELPASRVTEAGLQARATSGQVKDALLKLYRTEKIEDPGQIADPTRDWGEDGPPKGLIPLGQVIQVGDEYFRIRTYETGGKDVDRREEKAVPREMLAHLRSRAETLDMMSATLAEGCEAEIDRYAQETEQLLAEVSSPEGRQAYESCEKLLKEIDGWLKERPLDKYLPTGLAEAKADLAAFKKAYVTASPIRLLATLPNLHQRFVTLRETGKQLRSDYNELGGRISGIHLELSSILTESGLGDGGEIGARMGRLFDGGAERLAEQLAKRMAGKQPGMDPGLLPRIQDASAKMMGQIKQRTAGANDLAGEWRQKLEEAWRMKEGYSQAAIDNASATVDEITRGIRQMHQDLDGLGKMDDDQAQAFLVRLAARMEDSANGAELNTRLDADWDQRRKAVKERLQLIKEEKLGGRTNSEELKARHAGLKARIEATEAQVTKLLDRQWGIEQMDNLTRELEQLLVDVTGNPKHKTQKVSKITAKDRAEAIGPLLQRLANASAAAADLIDTKVKGDAGQITAFSRQIDAGRKALQAVKNLPDTGTLVGLCSQIDAKRGDESDTHEAKQQRREHALAELNRLRRIVSTHPAVMVYRGNPFDSGRVYPLVMGAFHRAEVGILVSVDPHAA